MNQFHVNEFPRGEEKKVPRRRIEGKAPHKHSKLPIPTGRFPARGPAPMNNSRCTPRRFCARITSLESTSRILSWRQRPRCLPCMSILPKPEKEEGDKEARWVFYAMKPTGGVYRTPVTYPRPYIPEKPENGSRISRVNRPSPSPPSPVSSPHVTFTDERIIVN